ncbi:MAG: oxygenase MpaB family protein [Cyanobacteria bacterium J06560_6]
MDTTTRPWPTGRNTRAAFEERFGSDNADFMQEAMHIGDPLADAVVAAIQEDNKVRAQLNQGVKNGLASVENPHPAIVDLLTQCETMPDFSPFLSKEELQALVTKGARSWYILPVIVTDLALTAGSLMQLYSSVPIATILAATGRLVEGVGRRIAETGQWVDAAMYPGNCLLGRPGYVETIQVRMIHAYMRSGSLKKGYDTVALGMPVSQCDLAYTWSSFTITSLIAAEEMGFSLTPSENAEIYKFWWYLGHLLGIDPRFYVGITNHNQATQSFLMQDMVKGNIASDGGILAKASNDITVQASADKFQIEADPMEVMESLAQRIHGQAVCNSLGIPFHDETYYKLRSFIAVLRSDHAKLRNNPEEWNLAISENLKEISDRLNAGIGGPTSYQAAAAGTLDSHAI